MDSSSPTSSSQPNHSQNNPINKTLKPVTNNNFISNCLIALPQFSPTLFKSASPSNDKPYSDFHFFLTTTTAQIVHNLHNSVLSSADRCLGLFHDLSSHNPFVEKILSLSHDFHKFCQIRRRTNFSNMKSITNPNFAAILPGDSVAGIVVTNGILNFLNIYNTLLVVRLVLTWFPNSPPAIVSPLSTLCDPYLNIFRGIIPPLGGTLDLSPILAFLVLNALTSTASALPAELPSTGGEISRQQTPLSSSLAPCTISQMKWMKRFSSRMPKSSKNQ